MKKGKKEREKKIKVNILVHNILRTKISYLYKRISDTMVIVSRVEGYNYHPKINLPFITCNLSHNFFNIFANLLNVKLYA